MGSRIFSACHGEDLRVSLGVINGDHSFLVIGGVRGESSGDPNERVAANIATQSTVIGPMGEPGFRGDIG